MNLLTPNRRASINDKFKCITKASKVSIVWFKKTTINYNCIKSLECFFLQVRYRPQNMDSGPKTWIQAPKTWIYGLFLEATRNKIELSFHAGHRLYADQLIHDLYITPERWFLLTATVASPALLATGRDSDRLRKFCVQISV